MRFSYMVTSLSVGTESTVEHDDPARITMAVAASRIFFIMRDCFVYYRDIECSGKKDNSPQALCLPTVKPLFDLTAG